VDASGFNWLVFIVAASGFFTDSYNLFASNVILPALTYVYWDGDDQKTTALYFNLATLLASATGQLAFGYFADRYGRKSLYGIELMIVITSTIGLLQCSNGVSTTEDGITTHTWNIDGWIFFWRVVMGIGIGAGGFTKSYLQT
jgi:PHS family inorganic phosphate transporter-like MFS transporter